MEHFHFLRPWWFLALVPALILVTALWLNRKNSAQWQKFIAPTLLPFLLDATQVEQRKWPLVGITLMWLIGVFALAGPAWQKIPLPVEKNSEALVICWDLSPSMLAEDIKPSRVVKSRLKLIDLLKSKQDGQVALIAYSGEAYTVTPLTDDFQTVINLLPALSPTTLPSVGSNPEMALEQARQLLHDGGILKGDILFITDEIEAGAMNNMTHELSSSPHSVTFWGVGTQQGAPIPLPDGGFAKSNQGEIVVAKLNEDALQNFAKQTHSYYVPMLSNDSDIETLNQLMSPQKQTFRKTDRLFDQWFEHGQYLALILLPFVALLFRKGFIFGLCLFCIPLMTSVNAQAFGWRDLWLTQDQQAQQSLQQGNEEAAYLFTTPERRGSTLHQQKKYEDAAQQFAQKDTAEMAYNLGNALTLSGEYDKAISAYKDALTKAPDFTEAKDNLAIAEQLAALQREQEQQEQNQDKNQDNQEQQSSSESNQNQDSQQNSQQDSQQQNQSNDKSQQQASDNDQKQEQMSEEQAQQQAQQEQQKAEDNPYSQAQKEPAESDQTEAKEDTPEQDPQVAEQAREKEAQDPEAKVNAEQPLTQQSRPQTEEEQMLEQWLRKVPDDPSGLMRNKFKYQYLQRRQSMEDQFSGPQNQAESRW